MSKTEQPLVIPTNDQVSISEHFGYTPQEVAVIQSNVAKGTSKVELAYFINVCRSVELNPFIKEIWCYKDKKNNLLVFAGRDGFLAKAQRNPNYNGLRSSEVCENDHVILDIPNGIVDHKIDPKKDRGKIIGAYCFVFRKGGEPTVEWVDFKTYNKGYNTWLTHPADMIKKVAETKALKKAFGISGIQSEYEFEVKNNVAIPINTTYTRTDVEEVKRSILNALKNYKGTDKGVIVKSLQEKEESGEFDLTYANNILKQLTNGK